jgi:S1-C subfamily serine protease
MHKSLLFGGFFAFSLLLTSCHAVATDNNAETNLYQLPTNYSSITSEAADAVFEISCDGDWRGSGWAIGGVQAGVSYIVTAYHVIDDCLKGQPIRARNQIHSEFVLDLINFDGRYWDEVTEDETQLRDIALLRADRHLNGLAISDSQSEVGHWALAVGFPGDHDGTSPLFTAGQVSGFDLYGMPTIDALISPGSSGGPLLNSEGKVTGTVFAGPSRGDGLSWGLVQPIKLHCEVVIECLGDAPRTPTRISKNQIRER